MLYHSNFFTIYFGDNRDAINKMVDCVPSEYSLNEHAKFAQLAQRVGVNQLAFLHQTHSNSGFIVSDIVPAFTREGDFLITARKNIGIGVLTADCLPIVFYDHAHHIAAVTHAGWRGTVKRIAQETVAAMRAEFGTDHNDLAIFFGPSANLCCYQVTEEFKSNVASLSYAQSCWREAEGNLFFDVPRLNMLQLEEIGVRRHAISFEYNFCTMCDDRFSSNRRLKGLPNRQATVIGLR